MERIYYLKLTVVIVWVSLYKHDSFLNVDFRSRRNYSTSSIWISTECINSVITTAVCATPCLWYDIWYDTRKDRARPALFQIFVLFYVFFVLFYVFLRCSLYCLCVYMCTVRQPPGGYPIAVKYIISYRQTVCRTN